MSDDILIFESHYHLHPGHINIPQDTLVWYLLYILHGTSFFIFFQSQFSHSVLIVGWWGSNSSIYDIETLDYVPIMYLMQYYISRVFGSCPLPATAPPLPLHSPFPVLCRRRRHPCAC